MTTPSVDVDVLAPAARLRATAAASPARTAIRWQDREISYRELDERVDAATAGLASLGIIAGDRVAIILGNVPAFIEAWYAVLRMGAVAVPAAPVLAPDELRFIIHDAGAAAAIVSSPIAGAVAGMRDALPALRQLIVVGADADGADARWNPLLETTRDAAVDVQRAPDELAALVYTSGTTGRPRGAMLTSNNLAVNQDQSLGGRAMLEPSDNVLVVLPLFHVYGLNVGLGPAITVGATIVLQERFDAATTADLIEETGVTVVLGAPPMYVAWAHNPPTGKLGTVRLCSSGAAPLSRAVAEQFVRATGLTITEGYGLTEASPSVTSSAMGEAVRLGSVGLPLPGVELRLVDEDEDVEVGDPGEVWVRGPNVFAGYWQDEAATARSLSPDGWLKTGDVGVFDEDGWLYLVDRHSDLIIVSGFNVYPREVERVLRPHPAVADCAVVGVPHPTTGESVVAFVVRAGDEELSEDELDQFCRTRLARYKCPSSIRVVAELPRTVTGKVRRADLRLG